MEGFLGQCEFKACKIEFAEKSIETILTFYTSTSELSRDLKQCFFPSKNPQQSNGQPSLTVSKMSSCSNHTYFKETHVKVNSNWYKKDWYKSTEI